MSNRKEQDRLQRLREDQIRARDPGASKIRHYDWSKHSQRSKEIKKKTQKPLVVDLYQSLPGRWKGTLNGLVVALFPTLVLYFFLEGDWRILAAVPLLFGGIIGFVIGGVIAKMKAP